MASWWSLNKSGDFQFTTQGAILIGRQTGNHLFTRKNAGTGSSETVQIACPYLCNLICLSTSAKVIAKLAEHAPVGVLAADRAAVELGVSRRQVYVLLERYRQGSGLVTDLVRRRSDGGKGGNRLSESVELVIRDLVPKRYLTRQKRTMASLYREIVRVCIARVCIARGLPVPARNTVEARIARMVPVEVGQRREGADSVRPLQSAASHRINLGTGAN